MTQIKIRNREGRRPQVFTHAIFVDDVAVGYGDERTLNRVRGTLEGDEPLALELKEEFRDIPEEW